MEMGYEWFILAAICMIVEIAVPTFFFLWPGLAAAVVGFIAILFPEWDFMIRLLIFGGLTLLMAWIWKTYLKRYQKDTDTPNLNKRAAHFVGQTGVVIEPIVNGRGRIKIGDSSWIASGADISEGSSVRVLRADGAVLWVEKI